MRELTEIQKNFLIDNFFGSNFAGAKNVAEILLEKGNCIVAGKDCIWKGGIGNFIKTSEAEEAYGCLKYNFNLGEFLSSLWYKEVIDSYLHSLKAKEKELSNKIEELSNLK